MSEQLTLQLPYEEITKVAGRPFLRDNFTRSDQVYMVSLDKIKVRDNFNRRSVYEGIEELADSIKEHGLLEDLAIDVLPNGTVYVERGHRRLKALQLLVERGETKFSKISCKVNKASITEEQRLLNIWISNMTGHQLTQLDQAETVKMIKDHFGFSHEKIAEKIHTSRQTVDNLMKIAAMNDGLKHDIRHKIMTVSAALELVANQKKLEKQADKEEDKSHITSASAPSLPEDPLKKELEELALTEEQAEEYKQLEAQRERDYQEKLEREAVLVDVTGEALEPHIGKRLAANALRSWKEDFVDESNGEVVSIEHNEIVMKQGMLLTADVIEDLVSSGAEKVWVLKEVMASTSVITEPVATAEKSTYDEDRPEIASIQNAIKLGDRIATQIEKADLPEGLKKDIASWSQWQMTSMLEAREWIHKNKKQNKAR